MKVLITGGAGFIGSHITDVITKQGYRVIVVDNLSAGNQTLIPEHVRLYKLDITSPQIEGIFIQEQPDYVIHLAAQINIARSIRNPEKDAAINIIGTIHLLNCCHKYHIKKIVYASSCAVYGDTGNRSISESFPANPVSFYGISKYASELYIKGFNQLYGLPYTILRYANVYGPRQSSNGEGGIVSILAKKLEQGEPPIIFGNGEQTRDFVYVKDVAKANLLALEKGNNETFNIGCDQTTSINQLYRMMVALKPNTAHSPIYKPKREGDILHSRLSYTKAKQILGWTPSYDLATGLKEMMDEQIS